MWQPSKSVALNCAEYRLKPEEMARISSLTAGTRTCDPDNGNGNGCNLKSRRRESVGTMGTWRRRFTSAPSKKYEVSSWNKSDQWLMSNWHPFWTACSFNLTKRMFNCSADRKSTARPWCWACWMVWMAMLRRILIWFLIRLSWTEVYPGFCKTVRCKAEVRASTWAVIVEIVSSWAWTNSTRRLCELMTVYRSFRTKLICSLLYRPM